MRETKIIKEAVIPYKVWRKWWNPCFVHGGKHFYNIAKEWLASKAGYNIFEHPGAFQKSYLDERKNWVHVLMKYEYVRGGCEEEKVQA